MALPFFPPLKTLFLEASTTTTAGAEIKVTVPCRSKYISTMLTILGTTAGGTSGFDVFAYKGAFGGASTSSPSIVMITTGAAITTTTGNVTFEFGSTVTPAIYFDKGDILGVSGSTGISGVSGFTVVHTLQEF